MDRKQHWEQVYATKASDAVSWFQEHAGHSLLLIHNTRLGKDAAIIDVGGGLPHWWMTLCRKATLT